ncbi:hypothetical protein [Bacillus badius]|uniref:LysM domain-containing protein n=1 Tax=Bacillus badius TaxID=1455 RepID=A0ABR5AZM7_BACBA|nr:hypothetical protein [Bacillus badius]KIL79698.1 hypothetical protein SD77_2152 [Bacillus badius]KZN98819.1 hypothetical protein A4244_06850 [Bacillus badius]MED0664736.1 hypothetical protein [Bacillus badius]MED4715209.1 hypothetical protein [Bacillus badius]OCS83755.1 hypothetical protein A6M11_06855 [Bacillus badius]
MKNFLIFIACILVAAGLWNDLTNGSLPHIEEPQQQKVKAERKELPALPYKEMKVEQGDTVLSILADLHRGKLPADIETAIIDFQELNQGISPDSIRTGEQYKFPLYEGRR